MASASADQRDGDLRRQYGDPDLDLRYPHHVRGRRSLPAGYLADHRRAGGARPGLPAAVRHGVHFEGQGQEGHGLDDCGRLGLDGRLHRGTLLSAPAPAAVAEEIPVTLVDRIVAGQDLYSLHCVECHGDDGSVAIIEGVEGLEGRQITPINARDVLYTLTDSAMVEVISYGRPNYGMNPFGLAHGGELTRNQIDHMVTFMRYAWDDRYEMPPIKPLFPALAAGEVPSYEVHIAPIAKRFCISCHREGKDNNDYFMTTYDES
jgi:mono/diheme cytochrome c family protein